MTSMERVLAALQGTEADRRAFTMTLSLYGAKLTGCPLSEYYTKPERYLEGQRQVALQCQPDIIFSPFTLALEAQAFGSSIAFLEKSPPTVKSLVIKNSSDAPDIHHPDIDHDKGVQYLLTSAALLADHFGTATPVCGVLTSPMDLPAIIMGVENWLEILLFDQPKAERVLQCTAEYFIAVANRLFDSGISFIAMAMVFTNPQILMHTTIAEFVVPTLSSIFSKVKGPLVFHHGSLPIATSLPLYLDIPNVAGFVLDHRDSLPVARANAGSDKLLLGNLDGPTLCKCAPERSFEKTRKILETCATDRHFIFATAGADVAWDTPLETIQGIKNIIEGYGS